MEDNAENDLPLMSNIQDILVTHYMFTFSCDFQKHCFTCTAVLLLEPVIDEALHCKCTTFHVNETDASAFSTTVSSKLNFILILDCHNIIIHDIEEVDLGNFQKDNVKYQQYNPAKFCCIQKLKFSNDEWSLKVWKDFCFCKLCFPKAIRISYSTVPEGPSLLWVRDQDKNPAVFTYGAWVNNRTLFPCQEPPSAMATWEATVDVQFPAIVLMSGDDKAVTYDKNGQNFFYYFTKKALPLSTLCLAVGYWKEQLISSKYSPQCRIFSPPSLMNQSIQELAEYVPNCLDVCQSTFGKYPFPRIDFLVVPPTFGSLGMASPNIVFLSQSLLTGNSSMSSRIAHEIAHGWFGLLIGASDWTEEWLSEGFATFVEDYFHVRTLNMSEDDSRDYIAVKTYIRLKTLLQEISNSEEELQVLRPSMGEAKLQIVDGMTAQVLKNGQNPKKAFIQVHYIKGYFLLKHLAKIVHEDPFMMFLKGYIEKYSGNLVTSKEFLTEFFLWFPNTKSRLSIETIYEDWLHNPGITSELKHMELPLTNKLYAKAMEETEKWKKLNLTYIKRNKKRKKMDLPHEADLTSEVLILFLENLLEEPKICYSTLNHLSHHFNFSSCNAEVQHRWLELVVKFKFKPKYNELQDFLTKNLAMGVYLFGEMLFSSDQLLQRIAKEVYSQLKCDMEPNYVTTIGQMLLDSEK